MVDLHTHILPDIDDGASSFEEALEMIKSMTKNGITTVVATPHFSFEKNNIDDFISKRDISIDKLKLLSTEDDLQIKILKGAELMFTPNLYNYDLNDFVIEGTDYILIELSTRRNEPELEYTLSAIIANGYIPILAHIERYSYLIQNSQRIVELIQMGVLMQVNVKSINDKKNFPFIDKMISKNLVHLVGSDAHDMKHRIPNLISSAISTYHIENQEKVIQNLTINVKKPRKISRVLGIYL